MFSVPSFDKARGVWGGVFFVRGETTSSVSFTFSKHETKEDCAESSWAAQSEGSGEIEALREVGFENWGAEIEESVVMAERGLRPLATRLFGTATPSLVERFLPVGECPLLRLRVLSASSLSVCVEEEAETTDERGGVKALGSVLFCLIDVASNSFVNRSISWSPFSPLSSGEVGAVGNIDGAVASKCLAKKSPTGISTASKSEGDKSGGLRKASTNLCKVAVNNARQTFVS